MNALNCHVDRLVHATNDVQRQTYLRQNPDLHSDDAARLICRSAVALLYSDVVHARNLCHVLTILARRRRTPLAFAYRDHAWGALHYTGGADYRKALARWKRAIASFEAAGRPDEAAITRLSGLTTLVYLDELDLFSEWVARAHAVFESNGDRLRLARLRVNAANLHYRRSEWRLAAEAYELAYKDLIGAGAGDRDISVVLTCLATCQTFLGDLPRAVHLIEKARSVCEDAGLNEALTPLDDAMAHVMHLRGDMSGALRLVHRVRQHAARNGLKHFSHESALTEAQILLSLGVFREAELRAVGALKDFVRLGLKAEQGKALTILGLCAGKRGRYRAALKLHAHAEQVFEDGANREDAQQAVLDQVASLLEAGDLDSASDVARDRLDIVPPDASTSLALSANLVLSRILLERGATREALELTELALARLTVLDRAPMEAEALHLFARIHERMGDLARAYDAYIRCERSITQIRGQLTPGELRVSFLSDKASLYEDLFIVGLRLQLSHDRLFEHVERGKSRTLVELLACSDPDVRSRAVRNPGSELLEVRDALRQVMKQAADLQTCVEPETAKQIEELRHHLGAAERATEKSVERFSPAVGSSQNSTWFQELAESIPPETALVEFFFARDTIFAFCICERSCEVRDLAKVDRVRRLHRLVRFQLRARPSPTFDDTKQSLLKHLRELYDLLWSAIRSQIGDRNVVIVPHGFLHHFPFHALFDGREYLVDRQAIVYSPSAGVFRATRDRPRAHSANGSLVIGFSDENAPAISSEVCEVAQMLPNARVLLDDRATKANFLSEVRQASLIHIAAHCAFSPGDPGVSAVRLADELLTAREIMELTLQAELVVLSGCETGRSATNGCDELLGLTQALLQAGARSAVVSLWNVDDHSTASFMRHFYSQLKSADDLAEALRRAQLAHRQTHSHPFFWAPFMLVGDPKPLFNRDLEMPGCPTHSLRDHSSSRT